MKSFILPPLLISSLCSGQINNAGTLNNEVRTRKFVQLLDRAGISPSIGKTIFAPSTDAWQDYREEDVDQWNKYAQQAEFFVHMREILLWHFVTEDKFTFTQIFNGNREFLQVRNGNITVYQGNGPNRKIDNVPATAFLERDIVTSDGMVHILSDVIVPPFLNQRLLEQLLDDQSATFAFSTWANLALWAGLDDHINGVYERGITLLVPPNRRFNRAEIDVPGLLTPEMRDYTRDLVLCHMIMDNYHEAGIFAMSESLLTDQHLVLSELGTHMWITTTGKGSDLGSQRVRFQSTEVLVFDQVAKNGIFHVLDFVLKPPSISDFVEFTAFSTSYETGDCFRFFRATLLSSGDISKMFDTPLTHFCPTEEAFKFFNNEDFNRLLEPIWVRHAIEFLLNHITAGAYSRNDLVNRAPSYITMLNGQTYELRKSGTRPRIKNGKINARSEFGDLIAIDGYVHILDTAITPTAVSQSVYDRSRDNDDFSLLVENIDFVDLTDLIDRDSPLTMLAPNNRAFERVTFGTLEGGDIIKRHLYTGLLFCDVIANASSIVSVDLEPFAVEVRGENQDSLWVGGAHIYECDIFARNGVLHYIDRVIGEPYETVPPTVSPAPTITAQPTIYVPPTQAPVPTPTGGVPIFLPTGQAPTQAPKSGPQAQQPPSSATSMSLSAPIFILYTIALYVFAACQ